MSGDGDKYSAVLLGAARGVKLTANTCYWDNERERNLLCLFMCDSHLFLYSNLLSVTPLTTGLLSLHVGWWTQRVIPTSAHS
eukprot:SAG11_NODE_13146_length_668_cov_0.725835_1_plen_82_part_00